MPIVWLDTNVRDSEENQQMKDELKQLTKSLEAFTNINLCEDYIRRFATTDKVILIVSGSIGSGIIPLLHDSTQLNVIYIYCVAGEYFKKKFEDYEKVGQRRMQQMSGITSSFQPLDGNANFPIYLFC